MTIHPILKKILDHKRDEVEALKKVYPETAPPDNAQKSNRSLYSALTAKGKNANIIAEIKRASPSTMLMPKGFDPVSIAVGYEKAGAAAISVLTDTRFFCGAAAFVPLVRNVVNIPVLRKEFIIDQWQLAETAALGADAVLLMAVNFMDAPEKLAELYELAVSLGLEVLMEIHSVREWEIAEPLAPKIVGINNRDFMSPDLKVDIRTTFDILPMLPDDVVVVSESGINSADEIRGLKAAGADGFLIGTAFMRESDPGAALERLLAICG